MGGAEVLGILERRTRQEHGPGTTRNPDTPDALPQLRRQKPGQREFLRPLRTTRPSREHRLLQLFDRFTAGRPILSPVRGTCRHTHGIVRAGPKQNIWAFGSAPPPGLIDAAVIGAIWAVIEIFHAPLFRFLIVYIAYPVYYVALTGLKGQTLGKMALGIMVVNAQGEPPGIRRAAFREIVGKLVSEIVIFLGYLWIGWDRKKRGWHDHIANTCVVRAPGRRKRPARQH